MPGHVDPSRDQFRALMESPDQGPVWMLNLIRLRKKARYDDKRESTGRDAYAAYAKESAPFFAKVGGRIIWSGAPRGVVIGGEDERWDVCFVAEYPSIAAFGAMVKDPGYQAIVHHRQAAVKDSKLIRLAPGVPDKVFG